VFFSYIKTISISYLGPTPIHFLFIPARHDMAQRIDCAFLAELVSRYQLDEDEVAIDLAYRLVKEACKL